MIMTAGDVIVVLVALLGLVGLIEFRPWENEYRNTTCKVVFCAYWVVLLIITILVPTMYFFEIR